MQSPLLFFAALSLACAPISRAVAAEKEALSIRTGTGLLTFQVELAVSQQERERGLMGRTELPEGSGMLFLFPTDRVARFWMVNTPLSVDALFIARDGTIRKIAEEMEPLSSRVFSSDVPVKAVLEIRGGEAKRAGIRVGDKVLHPFFGVPQGSPGVGR
ncbi:MAG: DUF192 domain-containing protein [Deltaproteobacteria bacterium]|nr:DUF192 domain-containing protein [Deltaproteobacteria bacterium]